MIFQQVVDDRLIVLPINRPIVSRYYRPIPIIGFSQSIGRYFSTKSMVFKKKNWSKNCENELEKKFILGIWFCCNAAYLESFKHFNSQYHYKSKLFFKIKGSLNSSFLLVNNRPIQSADSIGFWPIVSVSADSQNSTIGRPLIRALYI